MELKYEIQSKGTLEGRPYRKAALGTYRRYVPKGNPLNMLLLKIMGGSEQPDSKMLHLIRVTDFNVT